MSAQSGDIRRLLEELNDALALEDAPAVAWVVCGGTALALQGLASRTTRDVDVLGGLEPNRRHVVAIGRFPPAVERAIGRVALVHPELQAGRGSWVNLGPQDLLGWGLPAGCEARLVEVRVGDRLALHLLSRPDLVALKLLAASDDMGGRAAVHLSDLRSMVPTETEIEAALAWIERIPDPHQRVRSSLKAILKDLGHDDLAYYV